MPPAPDDERAPSAHAARLDAIEHMLDAQGRDLPFLRARIAAGRSGVALGFPREPMVHISWWALAAVGAIATAWSLRRRR